MKLKPALIGGLALAAVLLGMVYGFIGVCIWLIQNGYWV